MAIVVRLRYAEPDRAEVVDRQTLQQNAPRPFGFRPRPPAIPPSVSLSPDELNGLEPEEIRTRLGEKAAALVAPHYPNAGAVAIEWLGPEE
jgi:hypothetical protein